MKKNVQLNIWFLSGSINKRKLTVIIIININIVDNVVWLLSFAELERMYKYVHRYVRIFSFHEVKYHFFATDHLQNAQALRNSEVVAWKKSAYRQAIGVERF